MTAPRWWVLLLLSALFGMHGLQCVGADTSMPMPQAAVTAAPAAFSHGGWAPDEVTALQAAAPMAEGIGPSGLRAAVDHPGDGSPSGLMDHLGMLCLAVLAAGLAALALVLFRRRRGLRAALRHRAHRWLNSLEPPRPPDIYTLCVLRT